MMNMIAKIGTPNMRVGLIASLTILSLGSVLPINIQAAPIQAWEKIDKPTEEMKNWPADSQIQDGASAVALVNGGFETGDYTGWTLFESSGTPDFGTWGIASDGQTVNYGDFVFDFFDQIDVSQYSPGLPHTYTATEGNYLALQLQNGPETHRLSQDMTVKTCNTRTILSWDMEYYNWMGEFVPSYQALSVYIRDVNTDAILKTLFQTTAGIDPQSIPMTPFSADISEFAGMTVRLDVEMQVYGFYFDAAFDNFKMGCANLAGGVALTATKNGNQIGLELTTTSEMDTAKFQILRGIKLDNGGTKITPVCHFNSGHSPYTCTDDVVGNTYRVLEIENDGDLIVYNEVTPE
jgi:hypothetical protein